MRFVYPKLFIVFSFILRLYWYPFLSCRVFGVSLTRAKEFRKYWPKGFESEEDKAKYEWWREFLLIDGLNVVFKNIADSSLKVGDESMSAIRFWTMAKGNLPCLSYIFHNLEPLGTEFRTVTCSVTGAFLIHWSPEREGNYESQQVPEGDWSNCSIY